MRTEVIFCPSCNHKLRVPEELMGRPVQCPQCRATFLAPPPPVGGGERLPEPPLPRPQTTPAITREMPPESEFEEPRRRPPTFDAYDLNEPEFGPRPEPNEGKVLAPAFVLLAVSLLGMLANGFQVVMVGFMPNFWRQVKAANPFGQQNADTASIVVGAIFFAVSLFVAIGSMSMMKRRLYPIAVLGALAAMVDIGNCCCILSAPAGIWAMIVLFQPDVRASFR